METQTQTEKDFIWRVEQFSEATGMSPATIFYRVGYINGTKVNEFMAGRGTITVRVMGRVDKYIEEYNDETH